MGGQPRSRAKLSLVEQMGILVKDADKTVEYYNSILGLGSFMFGLLQEGTVRREENG